ncbi:MAG: cysteine--tRNA ligase [Phycisphaerales bacterium]|nr:cysteine--tRNA ligase [Phycisphaerales bacterium]
MAISIYNTLTGKKEPFEPLQPGRVGIYLCGPTVYKPSHIGHAVGPVIFDAIKRYLTFRGYKVTWVVNVTDVDDKLIDEAARQGTTTVALGQRILGDYLTAMKKLHIGYPGDGAGDAGTAGDGDARHAGGGIDHMPKASEHIGGICEMIQRLIARGHAYAAGGDVYFDVTSDPDYGKLSHRSIDEQTGQRELKSGEKRHPGDFALWKAAKPEEPDEVKYDSPWGKGRPGWHIECSAMSAKLLGETFDIHGGGMDLLFPHHENEIAQSESATGKVFAKYWMHHGLTRFNTKKVSKSDTSPEALAAMKRMTLHNLLKELSPEHVRFFILSTHYRRPIDFSDENLEATKKGLERFTTLFERVQRETGTSVYAFVDGGGLPPLDRIAEQDRSSWPAFFAEFVEAMDDDFNTAGAIAALHDAVSPINAAMDHGDAKADDVLKLAGGLMQRGRLLGLFLEAPAAKTAAPDHTLSEVMQVLLDVRLRLRKKKDFETGDYIRDALTKLGITLKDRADGTDWKVE